MSIHLNKLAGPRPTSIDLQIARAKFPACNDAKPIHELDFSFSIRTRATRVIRLTAKLGYY